MTNEELIDRQMCQMCNQRRACIKDNRDRCTEYEDAIELLNKKDKQYSEIIKEECNTSYESGLAEGERKAGARFKEYLENEIKSYKDMNKKFFVIEIQTIESIINKFFKEE